MSRTPETTVKPINDLLAAYARASFHFVCVPTKNGKRTKGPTVHGWNLPLSGDNPHGFTQDVQAAQDWLARGDNLGLALAPSRVSSFDIDDLEEVVRIFNLLGLPLQDWLQDPRAVRIESGRPNRAKLLFQVPDAFDELTRQLKWGHATSGNEHMIFELRFRAKTGNTHQDLLPPSVHPDTDAPYCLVGDVRAIPDLPSELLDLWSHWDAWKPVLDTFDPDYREPPKAAPKRQREPITGERDPNAEFNETYTVAEVLERNKYQRHGSRRYLRPGSESGEPGVFIFDSGCCFSHGADALNDRHPHDAFDVFRLLECNGDWKLAFEWSKDITEHNRRVWREARRAEREQVSVEACAGDSVPWASPAGARKDTPQFPQVPTIEELTISWNEMLSARPAPRCIVRNHLYADVALLIGPGGIGKTTSLLYETIHVSLARPLYGQEVVTPGRAVIVTAEDRRELMAARLRLLMEAMDLSEADRKTVLGCVLVWDVTGMVCRLTEQDERGNIVLTGLGDAIVDRFRDGPPALCVFDPCISFGAGERLVNDNEQLLILAARQIVRDLGCCVRLVHHSGKANAREKTLDQYTARGGSALSDGARMVSVMQTWEPGDKAMTPPYGFVLGKDETAFVLARPKLSYCAPQPNIWVKRRGYTFEYQLEVKQSAESERAALANQVEAFLGDELTRGRYHSKNTLETSNEEMGISQKKIRAALHELMVSGRVIYADLPVVRKQGGFKTYLHPVCTPLKPGKAAAEVPWEIAASPEPTPASSTSSATDRDNNSAEVGGRRCSPASLPPRQSILPRAAEVAESAADKQPGSVAYTDELGTWKYMATPGLLEADQPSKPGVTDRVPEDPRQDPEALVERAAIQDADGMPREVEGGLCPRQTSTVAVAENQNEEIERGEL